MCSRASSLQHIQSTLWPPPASCKSLAGIPAGASDKCPQLTGKISDPKGQKGFCSWSGGACQKVCHMNPCSVGWKWRWGRHVAPSWLEECNHLEREHVWAEIADQLNNNSPSQTEWVSPNLKGFGLTAGLQWTSNIMSSELVHELHSRMNMDQ